MIAKGIEIKPIRITMSPMTPVTLMDHLFLQFPHFRHSDDQKKWDHKNEKMDLVLKHRHLKALHTMIVIDNLLTFIDLQVPLFLVILGLSLLHLLHKMHQLLR